MEYLNEYFDITLYFYNPNISEQTEYIKRARELKRLTEEMPLKRDISVIIDDYNPLPFLSAAKGLEDAPERGARCEKCFLLRLEKTAQLAAENGFDYFCTTLSISPHKNAQLLNELGMELSEKYKISWLPSDFKKKEGFKRSTQLSEEYDLYRQNYCGCVFSKISANNS